MYSVPLKNPESCPLTWLIRLQTLRPTRRSPASQSSRTNPFRAELNEGIGLYSFLLTALIVDSEQKLVGIVTYPDLSRKLLPTERELMEHEEYEEYMTTPQSMEDRFTDIARIPVDQIMTRNVITVSPDLLILRHSRLGLQ